MRLSPVRFREVAPNNAQVVELVDTPVLEAGVERRASSSLALGTNCGISLMAEQEISNLLVRVRFPYPAPNTGFTLLPIERGLLAIPQSHGAHDKV